MRITVSFLLISFLLVIVLFSLGADITEPEKNANRVFLINNAVGSQTVIGGCNGASELSVESGTYESCFCDNPKQFLIGVSGEASVAIDATVEDHFDVKTGSTRIRGACEAQTGLSPKNTTYLVYVWIVEKGGAR